MTTHDREQQIAEDRPIYRNIGNDADGAYDSAERENPKTEADSWNRTLGFAACYISVHLSPLLDVGID